MAFCINGFEVGGHFYTLPKNRKNKRNRITVIVGPNGIGKTSLLAGLVYQFTGRRNPSKQASLYPVANVGQNSRDMPSRVIAQTFSPFSRFPREKERSISLNDYLTDKEERYAAIGITKNMGLRGSVSKEAVGRIIRKMYTRPDHALPLATAMETLGFLPEIKLGFSRSPVGRELDFTGQKLADLQSSVKGFLESVTKKDHHLMEERKLVRELDIQAQDELAKHIENAVLSLQSLQMVGKKGMLSEEYVLDLPLRHLGVRGESDLLEAVLTLTRLGLLRIRSCLVTPIEQNGKWASRSGMFSGALDIAEASSGQQQLLSSLFGIVAEAEDDSLILIDEPELSLHPAWQTQFIDLLIDTVTALEGCHIFIATHSALVAQRAGELGLDVVTLGKERSVSTANKGKKASVDQTLLDTFEFPVRDSTYVSRLLLALVMDAERSLKGATKARVELTRIKELYDNAAVKDKQMVRLIDGALDLVDQGIADEK